MRHRKLGDQGLDVAAIGLGTMGMTMAYGPGGDEDRSIATIRRAHELGVTLFDTAELYGGGSGTNEQLVGRAVEPFRDEVVIVTKVGFVLPREQNMDRELDSRPEHIREVADNSLRYLDADVIDVLYQHHVDSDRGFLTSEVKPASEYPEDDMRSRDERWQSKDISVTQLALAWLLAQGDDIVPIPGTRSEERLAENVGAADVELSAEDLDQIPEIVPQGAYGSRYPESMMPTW
jgi:aryl-alcohol dehydrogenase-like predicted oxidoreductase